MNIADYPPQEPFTAIGAKYHDEVLRRGAGIAGIEASYGADPYQGALVFPAPQPSGNVLVLLHGGGWTNGYKEWMAFMAPPFNAAGVTTVSLGYRLAPRHIHPAQFDDAQDGIAWVYRNIAPYGGDPARIFVHGHSAGGHLAALLGVRQHWQETRDLPHTVIRGCLPISGTYLFGEKSGLSMRPRFLGPAGNHAEADASPLHLIMSGGSPFLIASGEQDFPHLVQQGAAMEQALREAGVPVERMVLPGCDHLGASYISADATGPWLPRAVAWMRAA